MAKEEVRGKGVAIDGAAWFNMMRRNGIDRTNYRGLMFLASKVGYVLPFVEEPRSTILPEHYKKGGDLYESMCRAGILPRPVKSVGEADDRLVMRWLSRWVANQNVMDIVLATCDGEIIDFLLDAADRRCWAVGRNVRIDVFGTCTPYEGGTCPICRDVLRDMQRLPYVHFHEVAKYRNYVREG